ncbi:amidohydrolase family protein [Plantactinospora sp. B5E13]|uniref:amidohydrolase family protein n=1 Tax=unclassified Plantactinospora TaxID=2631981 RepID=UPI00325CC581
MPVFDFHVRLVPRPGEYERLLTVLDECQIERAAVAAGGTIDLRRLSRQLVEGGHVETDADNEAVLAAGTASGGRLVPFYFANPHRPVDDYARRGAEFHGLEISPAVHGVPLTDPRTEAFVAEAGRLAHPVYLVCLTRPGCTVADLTWLAGRHPEVTFVLGHSGIGNIDYHGVDLVAPVPNILVETSGGYSGVLRAAIDRLGARRVLFGSEFPLQHPSVELAKYRAVGLEPAQWALVAWENAIRLLDRTHPGPDGRFE